MMAHQVPPPAVAGQVTFPGFRILVARFLRYTSHRMEETDLDTEICIQDGNLAPRVAMAAGQGWSEWHGSAKWTGPDKLVLEFKYSRKHPLRDIRFSRCTSRHAFFFGDDYKGQACILTFREHVEFHAGSWRPLPAAVDDDHHDDDGST